MKSIAMKLATLGLLATVIAAPMTVNASGFDKQNHKQLATHVNRNDRKDGDRGYQQPMDWKREDNRRDDNRRDDNRRDDRRDRDDHRDRDDRDGRYEQRNRR